MDNLETQKRRIQSFFEGVIVDGVTRGVRFLGVSPEDYIEVALDDNHTGLPSVDISVPILQAPLPLEGIEKLLASADFGSKAVEVEDYRTYLRAEALGDTRYHVVSQSYGGGIVIDQIDMGQKYQQRVAFEPEEVEPLLRTLLTWHLRNTASKPAQPVSGYEDEEGGDECSGQDYSNPEDDHPF